jgi:hypothetical protein
MKSAGIFICAIVAGIIFADKAVANKSYHISRPKLGFDLSYEFDSEKRTGPFVSSDEDSSTYTEKLEIATDGWIYHPALAEYTLILTPEWEQVSSNTGNGDKVESRSFRQGYDADIIFLQYKPYTVTLFGSKTMSTVNSNFSRKSKVESDVYGMTVALKYDILPTDISYVHSESDQTGFYAASSEDDKVQLDMKYDRHLGRTILTMSYEDGTEITRLGNIGTTSQDINILNTITHENKSLLSSISYTDRKSNVFLERGVDWNESLQWEHAQNFRTNYTLRFESRNMEDNKRRENSGFNFELNHMLYENLATRMHIDLSRFDNELEEESIYSAGLDWNYSRAIPGGRINIGVSHNYRINDKRNDLVASSINIPNEPLILSKTNNIPLQNDNVILDTIKVFEDNNGIKGSEVPASEYDIVSIGSSTIIRLTTFPMFVNEGDPVLVDYSYTSQPTFDFAVFNRSYNLSLHLWEALKLYYRVSRSNQRFLRGVEPETESSL